jgi:hypothetical protein
MNVLTNGFTPHQPFPEWLDVEGIEALINDSEYKDDINEEMYGGDKRHGENNKRRSREHSGGLRGIEQSEM